MTKVIHESDNFVPKDERKAHQFKGIQKHKPPHIPKVRSVICYDVSLPIEYEEALKTLYPNLPIRGAIRKHIVLTVKIPSKESDSR